MIISNESVLKLMKWNNCLFYLFNGISISSGFFNVKIWLICKSSTWFIYLMAYQLFGGYLMLKFDWFVKLSLGLF